MTHLSSRALAKLKSSAIATATKRQVFRPFSSRSQPNEGDAKEQSDFVHPQDFVKIRFEPGEWDPDRTDPLHKPPFKSRAKIMSAEDFAERPRVGFDEEFDSFRDAMVTLSWMTAADKDQIYEAYLQLMSKSTSTTSHEYVMRVIAQKFNLEINRVASIIQMAHREDQYRKEGKKIYHDVQEYVDRKVKEQIRNAYSEFDETDPVDFVEDPAGVNSGGSIDVRCGDFVPINDLVDVDRAAAEAVVREKEEARLKIDSHIYREDIDETRKEVKLSKEAKKLMQAHKAFQEESERSPEFSPEPGNNEERRARWKYVAYAYSTRSNKNKKNTRASRAAKKKQILDNVLVEHDGELRPASVAEVKQTSWKPVRDPKDFMVSGPTGVKDAWLRRTLKAERGGWGRQEAPPEPKKNESPSVSEENENEEDNNGDEEASDTSETQSAEESDTTEDDTKENNDK
eukprot:CAMPEP_0178915906 /NCGR_PEP_ID=MMETSP0786-20121207/12309_1 /TAXON_ID=186022 /ORGANISM="Thalassionema frauenfeldii, Strain CCMP 1798" /LENGTH=455 /DNA_ID=CAMNT_0020589113 /DNA_START=4 /DNA_END=1371 /DNA_ORIENTATION=-